MTLPTSPTAVARRRAAVERLAAITAVLAIVLVLEIATSGQFLLVLLTSATLWSAWLLIRRIQQ